MYPASIFCFYFTLEVQRWSVFPLSSICVSEYTYNEQEMTFLRSAAGYYGLNDRRNEITSLKLCIQRNKGILTKTFSAQNVPYHAAICVRHKEDENKTVPLKDDNRFFCS
jgi:hypothetical protein